MYRRLFPAWFRPKALVLLAVLFGFTACPNPYAGAFRSISFQGNGIQASRRYGVMRQRTVQVKPSETLLSALRGQIEIRDFRLTDTESKKIYDFLLQRERQEREKTKVFFDPEGSLELDVSDRWTLSESYSKDDG